VTIEWSDGHVSAYSSLTSACMPLRACIDEFTHEVLVKPEHVPQGVKAEKIEVVGTMLCILTGATATAGIYSYDYLRSLNEKPVLSLVRAFCVMTAMDRPAPSSRRDR